MAGNVQQRQARFILAVYAATAVVYAVLAPLIGFRPACGAFGIFGLAGFTPLIGRKDRRAGKVVMDERDLSIDREATVAGYSFFWLFFVAACMIPWVVKGPDGTISVNFLMLMLGFGAFILLVVWSLVILILYRRQDDDPVQ